MNLILFSSDYYYDEDDYAGHGISDNKLNAKIYSSESNKGWYILNILLYVNLLK